MKRGMRKTAAACCIALLLLSGCGKTAGNVNSDTADSSAVTEQSDSEESAASQSDTDDIDSMFTDRDKEVGYDEEKCVAITLSDDGSSCDHRWPDNNHHRRRHLSSLRLSVQWLSGCCNR